MKYLTRTIWVLSLVSLFNDVSSEMLYPVMPLFLASIGFSSVMIGFLEGLAEATAGLSKGYFGRWSDASGKRLPFVQIGYLMSSVSKPMMVLFTNPLWIFSTRTTDRLGKGVRTAARDALLSDESSAANKGKVFGFHRALDTTGAAIGPAFALVFLIYFPGQYKWLFLLAFIPALLSVSLTFFIKEKKRAPKQVSSFRLSQVYDYLKESSTDYRKMLTVLLLFALFNSSDLFLLMKLKAGGLSDSYVITFYILYNLVFALAAFPVGYIADRIGLKKMLVVGLLIFVLVYAGFGFNETFIGYMVLMSLYGIYAACTDGISKALISNMVPKKETGSAIGTYSGLSSVMILLASSLAGLIWHYVSPQFMFLFSASGVLLVVALLMWLKIEMKNHAEPPLETAGNR
ncbi:MAG: MFS transporter [Bacteroidetes bacterium]|nr:MFS transporter [Bacteroidota bacterium]